MVGVGNLRTFEGDNVILQGVEFNPCNVDESSGSEQYLPAPSMGSIYFVHGLSGRWEDYTTALAPLANHFNVLAYNQRGHGDSSGRYDPWKAVDDLEVIIEKEARRPVGILAHSLGCHTAVQVARRFEARKNPLDGVYLMEPCLGIDSFKLGKRALFYTLDALSLPLRPLDWLLNLMPFVRKQLGLNQRYVIDSVGSIASARSSDCEGSNSFTGYALADNDTLLGTQDQKHYFSVMDRLRELFPVSRYAFSGELAPWDDSSAVNGLNHCFNREGHRPFMKLELGKDRNPILRGMYTFFKTAFEKH